MKTKLTLFILLFLGALPHLVNLQAQEKATPLMNQILHLKSLTDEQKSILKDQKQKISDSRNQFKNSLTKEQITILNDVNLPKQVAKAKLLRTLSSSQKQLLNNSINQIKNGISKIKPTLNKQQMRELKSLKNRFDNKKKTGDFRDTKFKQDNFKPKQIKDERIKTNHKSPRPNGG